MAVVLLLSHGMAAHYDATFVLPTMLRLIDEADGLPPQAIVVRRRAERALRRLARAAGGGSRRHFRRAVDGSHRYFAIPNNDAVGAIRINLIGREPHGRVAPGAEFEATCEQLRTRLFEWVNVETGEPVVRRVERASDHYRESPSCALPDLFVEWNRSALIRSIEAPGIGRVDREFTGVRTGDHRPGGLVVTRGPGIPAGAIHSPVRTEDLAPTLCAALGVDLADADGAVHTDLLAGADALRA
jgi:hypothetical protein